MSRFQLTEQLIYAEINVQEPGTIQHAADQYRQQRDPVLTLENINVSFDGFHALRNLSLQIGVGELRCIIGPNGAGKTTLMDVITGKTRPQTVTNGAIVIHTQRLKSDPGGNLLS
ncbi:ATP-binding cassette domain-containing protein [Yersinia pestis]|nr:ATP-binding cassette domain-containing protein [Yersinia pestis]